MAIGGGLWQVLSWGAGPPTRTVGTTTSSSSGAVGGGGGGGGGGGELDGGTQPSRGTGVPLSGRLVVVGDGRVGRRFAGRDDSSHEG